jgi:hypothetical protein
VEEEHVPGTEDDLPYDYGVETAQPADETLETVDSGWERGYGPVGETGPAEDAEVEPALGEEDERDLWERQLPLLEEDEEFAGRGALSKEDADQLDEALGELADADLTENPEETSATGNPEQPDHGGFPERHED